jgi:hypothetical protein
MPNDAQDTDNVVHEQGALVEKIRESKASSKAPSLRELLTFLFEKRNTKLSAADIEVQHYGYAENSNVHNPAHSRERISKLQECFKAYEIENPDDLLKCGLPGGNEAGGYQLTFRKLSNEAPPVARFWAAHMESTEETRIICDPLLFFYEHNEGKVLRFVDTNIEGVSRAQALSEMKRLHPKSYDGTLIPGHFYVDVGAILAAESLRDYFWRASNLRVPLFIDKDGMQQSGLKSSAILLGTMRTNTMIKRIFEAHETRNLAYRLHPDHFAWITISKPNDTEIKALEGLGDEIEWMDKNSFRTTAPGLTMGIVSRIPNPRGGAGVMTFISSDSTRNTSQMAAALTDDAQLRRIFGQMGQPRSKPLPQTFEMLFLVRLWPGNLDDEAREAELLAWRPLN